MVFWAGVLAGAAMSRESVEGGNRGTFFHRRLDANGTLHSPYNPPDGGPCRIYGGRMVRVGGPSLYGQDVVMAGGWLPLAEVLAI